MTWTHAHKLARNMKRSKNKRRDARRLLRAIRKAMQQ